ncbi:hypothetical protein QF034_002792 [Streptomyces africanus]|uniref:Uncharacterized protein n=1 Tax=Streptomyces africanus TaxID=231024 RepID=A0ABU0QME6_9ACTN|nr:hypothetical protein [Streptomyces africanus]MDQ0748561.1 hypothetical protein [Streptomyces africanus]
MFNSKKIAAAVGVLGSFALIGAGAVQAFADDRSSGCVDNGNGYQSCSQVREYQVTTDKRGNITVVNHSTQDCPASGGQIDCVSSFAVPGKQS